MAVGIRDLKNHASAIIKRVEEQRSSVVITRRGRPAALILPIDSPEAEDYVLAHAPEFVASLREAERDLREGRTVTLASYRRRRKL